ncbi:MAG: helix-turn-helix domain-containing protein [Desulfovibrionales bacterium]|nr:helix-turn-helix domain-containing protein [Desulfovibrionales bacterium]
MLQGTIDQLTALGNAIRIQRKKLKVTVVTAAESAGLSRVTWHRIEKGEPSVSAGAYFSALAVLGLQAGVQTHQEPTACHEADCIPVQIAFKEYPQLKFLAWQIHGTDYITPKEAWGIYQRNWRHVEEEALEEKEHKLIHQLQKLFEG